MLEDAADDAADAAKDATRKVLEKLPLKNLSTDKFGGDKLMELFGSDKWAGLSEACLGCGTCSFVCPTCQCYDIRDYDTGHGIQRFRCWDSCMYSDFTKTAGGQPRPTQLERFRQRFMHKLVYYPANNDGINSCVGCGRCVEYCPMGLEPVEVNQAYAARDVQELGKLHADYCFNCGSCSFVCPAKRPVTQMMSLAKAFYLGEIKKGGNK